MKHPDDLPGGSDAKQVVKSKTTNNNFLKRSNVMNYNNLFKNVATVLVALFLVATMAMGQSLIVGDGSTYGGSGTYVIKGSIRNTAATAATTIHGNVTIGNTSVKDTIGTGSKDINFETLVVSNNSTYPTLIAVPSEISQNLNIGGSSVLNTGAITLKVDATSTLNSTGTLSPGIGSTVVFDGTSAQDVLAGVTYDNLTLSGSATKTFPTGTTNVNTLLTANSNMTLTGTLAFAAAANANIAGNFTDNGTFTAPTTGTVTFTGSTISGTPTGGLAFNNLTIGASNGATTKTSSTDFSIAAGGQLKLYESLAMSSSTLTMKNGTGMLQPSFQTNSNGLVEIQGNMTWETPTVGSYTFNNASTNVNFKTAVASRTFTLNSQPNLMPTGTTTNPSVAGHTVKRTYTVAYSNLGAAADSLDLQLAYLNSEVGGASEVKLNDFQNVNLVSGNGISRADKIAGRPVRLASSSTTFGTVQLYGLSSLTLTPNSSNAIALDDRFTIYKSFANATTPTTNWSLSTTWDAGSVPTAQDEVEITVAQPVTVDIATAAAYKVTVDDNTSLTVSSANTLAVGNGGLINNAAETGKGLILAGTTSALSVSGNLSNNGAITNAGTITVGQ